MAIVVDNFTSGSYTAANTLSWSHTCTGSNLILFVMVMTVGGMGTTGVGGSGVNSITYGGSPLSLINISSTGQEVSLWYMVAPATGANTLVITGSGITTRIAGYARSYSGAAQTGIPDSNTSTTGTMGNTGRYTVNLTTVLDNCWTVGVYSSFGTNFVADTGQSTFDPEDFNLTLAYVDSNGAVTPAGSTSQIVHCTGNGEGNAVCSVVASFAPFLPSTSRTQSQSSVSRISVIRASAQTCVARLTVAGVLKSQPSISRIGLQQTRSQSATSRITAATLKSQPSTSRLQKSVLKSQPSQARLSLVQLRSQSAIANVQHGAIWHQFCIANISGQSLRSQPSTSRIQKSVLKSQSSTSRIGLQQLRSQSCIAHVLLTLTAMKSQPATARISQSNLKSQPSISRIGLQQLRSQSCIANVFRFTFVRTQTQPSISRIGYQPTRQQSCVANIFQPNKYRLITYTDNALPFERFTVSANKSHDFTIDYGLKLLHDSISTSTWSVQSGINETDSTFGNHRATIWLFGGVAGRKYVITNHITTANGRKLSKSFEVVISD